MAATLHSSFHEPWRELTRGRPGQRFQARYRRAHCEAEKCGLGQRIVLFAAALVCLVIAAILAVFPGPAIPFFLVAGGLLASESLAIARFMDWSEVRVRKLTKRVVRLWRRLPIAGRVVMLILGGCCSAGMAYVGYCLVAGG